MGNRDTARLAAASRRHVSIVELSANAARRSLLRAAGYPRPSLRLRNSDGACRESAEVVLRPLEGGSRLSGLVAEALPQAERGAGPVLAHRALADAQEEYARWLAVRAAAQALMERLRG